MHQTVHDEGRPGHIAGIFQKGNEQIQKQYVGQEDKHASHTSDDSVHNQVLDPSVAHRRSHEGSELLHNPLYPKHRVLSKDKGRIEDDIKQKEEYREGKPLVGHHGIYPVRECMPFPLPERWNICLGQCSLDKGIFRIHHGRLRSGPHQAPYPAVLLEAGGNDLVPVRKRLHHIFDLPVILQILYGKVAGGIFRPDVLGS